MSGARATMPAGGNTVLRQYENTVNPTIPPTKETTEPLIKLNVCELCFKLNLNKVLL